MDRKIKERLELALKPAKPPTLEEVLEQVCPRRFAGAGGLGLHGVDAVRGIRDAEDYRDVSVIGRGDSSLTSETR